MNRKSLVRKILLVDDDADDRRYFREALHKIDPCIEFVEAKDGRQALELLQNTGLSLPDNIFLDLRMPRYNGKQCLLQIRADERLQNIPVIIYSTSKEVDDSEKIQALGAVRFISKPSTLDEIYHLISLVLKE